MASSRFPTSYCREISIPPVMQPRACCLHCSRQATPEASVGTVLQEETQIWGPKGCALQYLLACSPLPVANAPAYSPTKANAPSNLPQPTWASLTALRLNKPERAGQKAPAGKFALATVQKRTRPSPPLKGNKGSARSSGGLGLIKQKPHWVP